MEKRISHTRTRRQAANQVAEQQNPDSDMQMKPHLSFLAAAASLSLSVSLFLSPVSVNVTRPSAPLAPGGPLKPQACLTGEGGGASLILGPADVGFFLGFFFSSLTFNGSSCVVRAAHARNFKNTV